MGWEMRHGRPVYYRKRRIGGQVVSEYVGAGVVGQMAAQEDASGREERLREREALRTLREQHRQQDALSDLLNEAVRAAVGQTMKRNGFRKHKGQWRRRR